MQKNRSIREKITASVLVICLLMSYLATFSSIYVTYASDEKAEVVFKAEIVDLNSENSNEQSENNENTEETENNEELENQVETEEQDENSSNQEAEVNLQTNTPESEEKPGSRFVLKIKVGVKNNGYLKNGKIEISDLENQIFSISEFSNPIVQSISDGVIKLKTIDAKEEYEIEIPLELKKNADVSANSIENGTKIKLTGIYVDEQAVEEKVEREQTVFVEVENERKIEIGSNIEKFIKYTQDSKEYALIQVKVEIQDTAENLILPVKSTDLAIKLPEITVEEGKEKPEIEKVLVVAKNTGFTNGKLGSDVKFTEDNYSVNNDGKLNIHVENKAEDGKYKQTNGKDEYLIELTYNNAENIQTQSAKGKIEATISLFDKKSTKDVNSVLEQEYKFDEASTNKVTYDVRTLTEKISKGNIYANINKEDNYYETEYKNEVSFNISRTNSIKTIEIREYDESYYIEDGSKYSTKTDVGLDTYYKTSTFNKENLVNIIGENGSLEILNEEGDSLITINKDTQANEEGNIVYPYNNKIEKIVVRVNNPEKEGILNIQNTKAIEKSNYTKESLVQFKGIANSYNAAALYDEDIKSELGIKEIKTEMVGTKTRADMEISRGTLSTIVKNEDVEFDICLNNSKDSSDMYINPEFEITLPAGVTTATIKDINVLYGNNELIKSEESRTGLNDNNQVVIYVKLDGVQKNYSIGDTERGTTIVVKTDIELDRYLSNREAPVELRYRNENATEYGSEVVDGVAKETLNFKFQGGFGVVASQRISGYNADNYVMSMNQGEQIASISDVETSKQAEMEIALINNNEEIMENPIILGRIPFDGVTSISSSESLGANVNTKMTSGIEKIVGKDVKVYYSENGEATKELDKAENGWREDIGDLQKVKSYLIVVDGNIEIGESLALKYGFEIPENLGKNASIFGTFGVYYDTEIGTKLVEANKVGLETEKEEIQESEETVSLFSVRAVRYGTNIAGNGASSGTENNESSDEITNILEDVIYERPRYEAPIDADPIQIQFENESESSVIIKGGTIEYNVSVRNMKTNPIEDVGVTITLPQGLTYIDSNSKNENDINTNGSYNTSNRTVSFNFNSIDKYEYITLKFSVDSEISANEVQITTNVQSDDIDKEYNNTKQYTVKQGEFEASYSNLSGNNYIKSGEEIKYKLTLVNVSGETVSDITVESDFPDELSLQSVEFVKGDYKTEGYITNNSFVISQYLLPNESFEIIITAEAGNISASEKQVSNYLTVTTDKKTYRTESVETIIQQSSETSNGSEGGSDYRENSNGGINIDTAGEYKITGTAWIDKNMNGSRDSSEKGLEGIVVKLFNANTNQLVDKTTTDGAGGYIFTGLSQGNYYIIFEYDGETYSLTDYQKSGVSGDKNSDAILSNGETRTDTIVINDRSISNIDIGLIQGNVFDLTLEKTVSKITVQNDNGTKVIDGNDSSLAKVEIKAKDLASSTVYIEYKIKVTNNGQIPGIVQKIVDYLPKDTNLNTEINPNWYIGNDGYAYNEQLSGTVINPKETKEISLIISKDITENNTGLTSNKAEIALASNELGIQDIDSSPGNSNSTEDDMGQADVIISISTGGGLISASILITVLINLLLIGYVIKRKIDRDREVIL